MKTLLITWWTWFIWSCAVVEFEKAGYKTVIVDNLSNSDKKVLDNIKKVLGYDVDFFEVDLLDKERLENIFKKYNFDGVIHFAWLKAVWESCEKPLMYFNNNIIGSLNLFSLMEKYNVNNLIFSSSATVYDLSPNNKDLVEIKWKDVILRRWIKETDITWNTTNPYWKTKFILEEILKDLAKFSNFKAIILRYFNPIGAHTSGLIWENPKWIPNNLLPYIMKVAKWELHQVNVFWNDYPTKDGTWVRDYINVNDLVSWHIKAYKKLEKEKLHYLDVFNLWVWEWVSVLEMIKTTEEVVWKKITYKIVQRRPWDLAEVFCDPSKANKILNWEAKTSLKESIKQAWSYYNQLN